MTRTGVDSDTVATMRADEAEAEWVWLSVAQEARAVGRERTAVYRARLDPTHPVHVHSRTIGQSVGAPEHLIRAWWKARKKADGGPARVRGSLLRRGLIDVQGKLTESGLVVARWVPSGMPGAASFPWWAIKTRQQWEALKSIASEPTTTEENA